MQTRPPAPADPTLKRGFVHILQPNVFRQDCHRSDNGEGTYERAKALVIKLAKNIWNFGPKGDRKNCDSRKDAKFGESKIYS